MGVTSNQLGNDEGYSDELKRMEGEASEKIEKGEKPGFPLKFLRDNFRERFESEGEKK